jgi:hypothetical protein
VGVEAAGRQKHRLSLYCDKSGVASDSRRRRAFVSDGSVHRKTLGLADNLLSGPLPAWALRRSALDDALVVLLQARRRAARRRRTASPACICRTFSHEVVCANSSATFIGKCAALTS